MLYLIHKQKKGLDNMTINDMFELCDEIKQLQKCIKDTEEKNWHLTNSLKEASKELYPYKLEKYNNTPYENRKDERKKTYCIHCAHCDNCRRLTSLELKRKLPENILEPKLSEDETTIFTLRCKRFIRY